MGNWGWRGGLWRSVAIGGWLICVLATEAFSQHQLQPYPVGDQPDPRLVLLRRSVGKDTYLCSASFIAPLGLQNSVRFLLTADHCTSKDATKYRLWTKYLHTAKKDPEHGSEADLPLDVFTKWPGADVAAAPVKQAEIGDGEVMTLAAELPKSGEPVSVLSFVAGSRGGYGPYALRCTLFNRTLFTGDLGLGDGRIYARIAYAMVCPWIVSPDGISGSAVVNSKGESIGVVNAITNSGNGFHSAEMVVLDKTRSKSYLFFTPVLSTSFRDGKFDLEPRDGMFSEKNEDGSTLEYSIVGGKLDGMYRSTFPTGHRAEVEVRQGVLHGRRQLIGADGTLEQDLRYKDGKQE